MSNNYEHSKHGWKFVAGIVIAVLIAITALFFYTGNILSGLIMTGILVLLVVSASRRDRNNHQLRQANLEFGRQNSQDAVNAGELTRDLPPSYRQTWRRSFIEKFKDMTTPSQNLDGPTPYMEVITTISGSVASHPSITLHANSGSEEQQPVPLATNQRSSPEDSNSEVSISSEGLPSFEEAINIYSPSLVNNS